MKTNSVFGTFKLSVLLTFLLVCSAAGVSAERLVIQPLDGAQDVDTRVASFILVRRLRALNIEFKIVESEPEQTTLEIIQSFGDEATFESPAQFLEIVTNNLAFSLHTVLGRKTIATEDGPLEDTTEPNPATLIDLERSHIYSINHPAAMSFNPENYTFRSVELSGGTAMIELEFSQSVQEEFSKIEDEFLGNPYAFRLGNEVIKTVIAGTGQLKPTMKFGFGDTSFSKAHYISALSSPAFPKDVSVRIPSILERFLIHMIVAVFLFLGLIWVLCRLVFRNVPS